MKIWITAPFDDNGIEEAEICGEPNDANLQIRKRGGRRCREQSCNWYREGFSWHRTYEAALEAARQHRSDRLAKSAAECARIAALPAFPSPKSAPALNASHNSGEGLPSGDAGRAGADTAHSSTTCAPSEIVEGSQ